MRKLKCFTKTLLVAACLLAGATCAWATTTLTYDFSTWASSGYTFANDGTGRLTGSYKPHYIKDIYNGTSLVMNLNKNFYAIVNSNNWKVKNNAFTAVKNTPYFIPTNLATGDKITITFTGTMTIYDVDGYTRAAIYLDGDATQTEITTSATITSGSTYVVKSGSTLPLTMSTNGTISSVVIVKATDETKSADPTIAEVASDGGTRTVRITGMTGSYKSPSVNYYTTDGSDPTTSTETKFNGYSYDFDISTTSTIKVLSVLTSNSEVSATATATIEAGSQNQLNTPTIVLSGIAETGTKGIFNPVVTVSSDNSEYGSPSISYTATFTPDGGDAVATSLTDGAYTFTEAGTLTVYSSADGFDNSENATYTTSSISYAIQNASPNYSKVNSSNITAVLGNSWTIESGDRWANWSKTGGINADGTANGGESYYYGNGDSPVNGLLSFNSDVRLVVGYGFAKNGAASCYISNAPAHAIASFTINSGTTTYVANNTEDAANINYTIPQNNPLVSAVLYAPAAVANTLETSVTSAGFATFVPTQPLDFSAASIEAYKVKVNTKGVATLTKVEQVPAYTPVLLYKDGGATENIPVITGATAIDDNDLLPGTGATVATTDGEYTNMILNNVDGIGFYFANGQTVDADKAYLHIASTLAPDAATARMLFVLDGETTAISNVKQAASENAVYNLSGQRVSQPAKGLYIVNGKKVVIK